MQGVSVVGKRFKFTYLLVLLTFSFRCLSYDGEINNLENVYINANYFGAFFNVIGSLEGKEDAGDNITEGVFSFNKNGKIEAGYNPKYVPGFAGSAAIGYLFENMRVELEGLYSQTNLYDEDYSDKKKQDILNFVVMKPLLLERHAIHLGEVARLMSILRKRC